MRPILSTTGAVVALLMMLAAPASARQRRGNFRRKTTLKVGDPAPDFSLVEIDEKGRTKGRISLSSFMGRSAVVLAFSSYT